MVLLLRNIDNYVPSGASLSPLVEGVDYTRHGDFVRITTSTVPSYRRVLSNGPIPPGFRSWPVPVGRYSIGGDVVDVVFSFGSGSPYRTNTLGPWDEMQSQIYTKSNIGTWPLWRYDYMTNVVSTMAMYLLQDLPAVDRIGWKIARHLASKLDQSNFSQGVIHGNWNGSYEDATNPGDWKSSAQVCYVRLLTGSPAKYGQCWVFAETLTAMCRFLGIPARTVQAYGANIDIGCNGGNDYLGSSIGKSSVRLSDDEIIREVTRVRMGTERVKDPVIPKAQPVATSSIDIVSLIKAGDSSWNFHIWTEVWTPRGWEIIDPSPIPEVKTENDGIYSGKRFFGPCPITKIRDGIRSPFDYGFLFSAINGVPREWEQTLFQGEKIIYPARISYNVLNATSDDLSRVELFTRGRTGKESITGEYRYPVMKMAMRAYHREHPFLVEAKGTLNRLSIRINDKMISDFLVQLVYLRHGAVILCQRQRVDELGDTEFPAVSTATSLSVLVVDIPNKRFWAQVVKPE